MYSVHDNCIKLHHQDFLAKRKNVCTILFCIILCEKNAGLVKDIIIIYTCALCNKQCSNQIVPTIIIIPKSNKVLLSASTLASIGIHSKIVLGHSSPSDVVHCRLWPQSTVALDHLQDEKVTVSETDEEVWIAGGRVHAL